MKLLGENFNIAEILNNSNRDQLIQLKFETLPICNLSCKYCRTNAELKKNNQNHREKNPYRIELFKKLLDDSQKLGLQVISFEGRGEPIVDPNFINYYNEAKYRHLIIKLHTNLKFLKNNPNNSLLEYDKLVLITTLTDQQEFKNKKELLKQLSEKFYKNDDEIRLATRILIFKDNFEDVKTFFKFCLENNIYPKIQLFYPLGRAINFEIPKKYELKKLYSELKEIRNKEEKKIYIPDFPGYESYSIYYTATVDVNDDVKLLPEIDDKNYVFGSLKDKTIYQLWMKEDWLAIRHMDKFIEGKCASCSKSKVGCYGNRVWSYLAASGKSTEYLIFKEDPFCWKEKEEVEISFVEQILNEIQEVIKKNNWDKAIVVANINDWSNSDRNIHENVNSYNLMYRYPSFFEEAVLMSKNINILKYFYDSKKLISGINGFAKDLMDGRAKVGFYKNWQTKKGVAKCDRMLFSQFDFKDKIIKKKSIRNIMYIGLLKVNQNSKQVPYGMIFITFPNAYLKSMHTLPNEFNNYIEKFSGTLYNALLRDYYQQVFVKIFSSIQDFNNESDIKNLIYTYLDYGLALTSIQRDKNEYNEIINNFNHANRKYFRSVKNFIKKYHHALSSYIIDLMSLLNRALENWDNMKKIKDANLKIAIISILVDSYAHNISAHSLAALKWWFQQRSKILEKRIYANQNELKLEGLMPSKIIIEKEERENTTEKYYQTLDLTDSTYNSEYYSLFDYLQFTEEDKNLFLFSTKVLAKWDSNEDEYFNPRFPVPLDYAIYPFMRFLKDKGAFWSGVTRDRAFGGESKTLYQILWEDFANNPLYLGTIAYSEGISKLNIYLAFENDNEIEKSGRFVTIDLSVIKYESDLANPYNENIIKQEINSNEKNGDEQKNKSINCEDDRSFVEYNKYSQYGFVRLGECFSYFRKELCKDEYKVFLPGGVVGEHALFTIIENTIRNIKHYKGEDFEKIKNNGIDLYISIQYDNKSKDRDGKVARLKIGVWLDHDTDLSTKVTDKDGKTIDKKIIEIMEEKARDSIVNELGVPRMGGNSQDKACAAMLFNNNFLSVESQDSKLQKDYYPWIEFREEPPNSNKGIIKKYFIIWKSEDVYLFEGKDINELREKIENENISRFKFFIDTHEINLEMNILLREKGVIRILDNINSNKKTSYYYKKWLENWTGIKFNNNKPLVFLFSGGSENIIENTPLGAIWIKDNTLVFNSQEDFPFKKNDIVNSSIVLSHGKEKGINCNVRSHGQFIQRFFKVKDIKELPKYKINVDENGDLIEREKEKEKNEILLLEFIETVKTKIVIFDNRVNDRFSLYSDTKKDMFKNQLFLEIYPEDKSEFDKFKSRIKQNKRINILIMHLSFIENLKDEEGKKYSEKRIVDFIEKELIGNNNGTLPDNFIFVITSGRGRDDWNSIIRNNDSYTKSTLFKPIETILNAVETGISYNDHFDIKYNLVKAIFGS